MFLKAAAAQKKRVIRIGLTFEYRAHTLAKWNTHTGPHMHVVSQMHRFVNLSVPTKRKETKNRRGSYRQCLRPL